MKGLRCVVDIEVIRRNLAAYRRPIVLMAKADCYGLGSRVAVAVQGMVAAFGVAYGEEGRRLRRSTDKPILVTTPWWTPVQLEECDLTPCIGSVAEAERLAPLHRPMAVHVALDTGMHRFGVRSAVELRRVLDVLGHNPNVRVVGACTHYASDMAYDMQNARLRAFLRYLPRGITVHTQATSTAYHAGYDMLRIGMGAYRDSACVYSRLLCVRRIRAGERVGYDGVFTAEADTDIGVVLGGYADGIDKRLVGHRVACRNRWHPIVAVCMDVCMVALTAPCRVGDEVTVIGATPDPTGLSLYELYTGLHGRCTVEYRGDT